MKQYPIVMSFFENCENGEYKIDFNYCLSNWKGCSFSVNKDCYLEYPLPETQQKKWVNFVRHIEKECEITNSNLISSTSMFGKITAQHLRSWIFECFVKNGYIYQTKPRFKNPKSFIKSHYTWTEEYFVYRP